MFSKGVSRRWMVNTIGVVFLILLISITTLSFMAVSYTHLDVYKRQAFTWSPVIPACSITSRTSRTMEVTANL